MKGCCRTLRQQARLLTQPQILQKPCTSDITIDTQRSNTPLQRILMGCHMQGLLIEVRAPAKFLSDFLSDGLLTGPSIGEVFGCCMYKR